MQEKQTAGIFLEIFVIVGILGILSAITIPYVGQMTDKNRNAARANEYHDIQIAVAEMLNDSITGTLVPIGPTMDMSRVRTSDARPLVLTDYLPKSESKTVTLGCSYIFTPYGTVMQELP
jgi:type II secretory pathway pseudopilin PulG